MYKHIIPVNMLDNGNIGNGMLKKRNCIEAGCYALLIYIILRILSSYLSLTLILILGAAIGAVPALFLVIGVGEESVVEAILTYITFRRQKKVLRYSLAECLKEVPDEKSKKKEKKLTKEEKKIEKQKRKNEKQKRKKEGKEPKQKKEPKRKKERKKKKSRKEDNADENL